MSDDTFISGASFILDAPEGIPARWGAGTEVLWARGESLIITGPPGVGKTSLIAQLVMASIGIRDRYVLGFPVDPAARVLYLAADRPSQIARVFRRLVTEEHRETLDARLVVLRGPPSVDLARRPETLRRLIDDAKADMVYVDSLKDVTVGLTEDDIGAGINRAFQLVLADGIDVCALHHQRKSGNQGAKPRNLEDVYGSAFITAGAGSVILLWGKPGEEIIELDHLKQPATPVGPFKIEHNHETGIAAVVSGTDLLTLLAMHPTEGLTLDDLARRIYSTEAPTANERKRIERQLRPQIGVKVLHTPQSQNGSGMFLPGRYYVLRAVDITVDTAVFSETVDSRGQAEGKILDFPTV